jgi:hypothetical protein
VSVGARYFNVTESAVKAVHEVERRTAEEMRDELIFNNRHDTHIMNTNSIPPDKTIRR